MARLVSSSFIGCCVIRILVALALAGPAMAATVTFTGTNNANWNNALNWSGGIPSNNDTIVFNSTTSGSRLSSTCDLTLTGITLQVVDPSGTITISVTGSLSLGAGGIDMSTATQSLTLSSAITVGAAQSWTVASGKTLTCSSTVDLGGNAVTMNGSGNVTFSNVVSGSGGSLVVDGATVLTGSSANTFTGGITVKSGTFKTNNQGTPGPLGTGTLTIQGGTVRMHDGASRSFANALDIQGSCTIGDGTSTGGLTFTGGATISGTPTITLPASFAGLTLSTATCTLNSNATFEANAAVSLSGGLTFTGANRTLTINGSGQATLAGTITNAAGTDTLTVNGNSTNVIIGALAGSCGEIIFDGPTSTANTSTNSFSGGITLTSGILKISNAGTPGPLGTGTLTIQSGTVRMSDGNGRSFANAVDIQGSCTLGDGTNTGSLTFTGGLTVSSSPTITLPTGFGGATFSSVACTLNSGLNVTANANFSLTGGLTWSANRVIALSGSNTTTISGALSGGTSTLTVTGADCPVTLGTCSGACGGLIVNGPVVYASSTAGSFTGGVVVQAGRLRLDNSTVAGSPFTGPVGTGTITLQGGAVSTGNTTGRNLANAVAITGSCSFGHATNTGALAFSGGLTVSNAPTLTRVTGNGTLTFDATTCTLNSDLTVVAAAATAFTGGFTWSANRVIALSGSSTTTLAGALAGGTSPLTVTGADCPVDLGTCTGTCGGLIINGPVVYASSTAGSFTGGVVVQAGRLRIGNSTVAGSPFTGPVGTGTITVLQGGTLSCSSTTGRTLANALGISGNCTLGHASETGPLTINGTSIVSGSYTVTCASDVDLYGGFTFNSTGSFTLTVDGGGDLDLGGTLTGGANTLTLAGGKNLDINNALGGSCGGLIIDGPTISSTSASTFSGGVTLQSGVFKIGSSSNPTTGTVTSGPLGTGTLTVNSGKVQNNTNNGNRTCANPVIINGSCTLGDSTSNDTLTFTGGLTVNNTPTITMATSFLGATFSTVACSLNSDLNVDGLSTLNLTGGFTFAANRQIAALSTGAMSIGGALSGGANTLTLVGSNAVTSSVALTGSCGGIVLNGPTVTVSSASTFTGGFTVQAGILKIAANSNPTSGVITTSPLGKGTLTISGGKVQNNSNNGTRTCANAVAITGSCTIGDSNTASDDFLIFTGGLTISGSPTVTIPSEFNGLTFSTVACTLNSDVTISAAVSTTLSGGFTFSGANRSVTLTGSGALSLSGAITNASGADTLTLAGTASAVTLGTISGSCGGLVFNGPTITANSTAGTFSSPVTLQSGVLYLNTSTTPTSPPLAGGTGPIGTGTLTISGGSIGNRNNGSRTLANALVIQGSCTFGYNSTDYLTFTGAKTISGTPSITLAYNDTFSTGTLTLDSDATVTVSAAATPTWSCGITTNANRVLTVNDNGVVTTFLQLSGPLSGAGTLTLQGNGRIYGGAMSGANAGIIVDGPLWQTNADSTYTNTFELRSGRIRLDRNSNLPTNGPLGLGTLILAGGRLGTNSSNSYTLGNPITLKETVEIGDTSPSNTGAITLSGVVTMTAAGAFSTNRNLTLTNNLANGGFTLTIDGQSGTTTTMSTSGKALSGTGGLVKNGASTLNLGYAHSYSGTTVVNGGTFLLYGSNGGAIASSSAITINAGGTFQVSNTSGTNVDRIGDAVDITLNGGAFSLLASSNENRTETIGRLLVASGSSTLTITSNTTRNCQLTCADATLGLVRSAGATLTFNRDPGTTGTANLFVSNGLADEDWLPWCTVVQSGTSAGAKYDSNPSLLGVVQQTTPVTTYTTQAAGNWTTGATWVGGSEPPAGSSVTILHAVTMDASRSMTVVSFDTSSSTGSLTAGGGTLTITQSLSVSGSGSPSIACPVALGAANIDLNHIGSGTLTISGIISGSGNALTLLGTGTTVVSGANTFTGGCTLTSGTLDLGIDSTGNVIDGPVGTGTLALVGGTIRASGAARSIANAYSLNGTVAIGGSNDLTLSGAGTLTAASTLTLNNSGLTTFSGTLGGSYTCTKSGTGTLRLSSDNGFTGDWMVTAGTVQARHNGALGTTAGGVVLSGGAVLDLAGGITITGETVTLGSYDGSTAGTLLNSADSNTWTGPVLVRAATSVVQSDAGTLSLSGQVRYWTIAVVIGVTFAGAGDITAGAVVGLTSYGFTTFTKNGAGTLTIIGGNYWSSTTTINGGTLRQTAAAAIPDTSAVTVASGAAWDMNNCNETITSLAGAGNVSLGSGNLTLTNCGGLTYSGAISGSGAVSMAGNWTLSGQSTFSGGLTMNGGNETLTIGADSTPVSPPLTSGPLGTGTLTLAGGSNHYIRDDGALRSIGNAIVTGWNDYYISGNVGLTLNGPMTIMSSTRRFQVPAASCIATVNGVIDDGSGTYDIWKDGLGTLILGGTNTLKGKFQLCRGTLKISANANLGASSAFTLGENTNVGILQITGGFTTTRTITLQGNDNHQILVDPGVTCTWNGVISGTNYSLTKSGTGTLVLGGVNTFGSASDTLSVSAGTLAAGNTSGSAAGWCTVNVASGATLAGTGGFAGSVNLAGGSTLSPGLGGVGTLTTGALTLTPTTALAFDLGASSDRVVVNDAALVLNLALEENAGSTVTGSEAWRNTGSFVGNPAWTASGASGNAVDVDYRNGDDYVEIANSTSLQTVQAGDYTLSAWFKPGSVPPGVAADANDAAYGVLFKQGYHLGIYYTNAQKFALVHWLTGNVMRETQSNNTYAPGSFYHVAGVVSKTNGTIDLYVNGGLAGSTTFTPGTAARDYGTTPWRLGIGGPGQGTYRWAAHGTIDEARIYARTLSATEIAGLAQDQPSALTSVLTCDGQLTVTDSGSFGAGTYTLFTYTGGLTDNRITIASLPGTTCGRITTATAGQVDLVVAASANTAPGQPTALWPVHCPDAGTAGPADDLIDTYGRTLNPRPRLLWDVPADAEGQGLHFQVFLDSTAGTTLVADSALSADRARFAWYDGAAWVALPGDGASAGSGKVRYTPVGDLATDDDHFFSIRPWDGTASGTDSTAQRFLVGTRTWTNPTLAGGDPIRAIHLTELREEANWARNAYGLADVAWTDGTITPRVTAIRAVHFTELRSGLTAVRDLTGTSVTIGAQAIVPGGDIRSSHIAELRTALGGL